MNTTTTILQREGQRYKVNTTTEETDVTVDLLDNEISLLNQQIEGYTNTINSFKAKIGELESFKNLLS